jgi:hypothetical protein
MPPRAEPPPPPPTVVKTIVLLYDILLDNPEDAAVLSNTDPAPPAPTVTVYVVPGIILL